MNHITLTVPLARGSVSLRAWGAHQTEALTLDLMTVTATLAELRQGEHLDATPEMVEIHVWEAYFRLLRLSLDGTPLPKTTFAERIRLLDAMWQLNDLDDSMGKVKGLGRRAQTAMERRLELLNQAHQTPAWTNLSSGPSA